MFQICASSLSKPQISFFVFQNFFVIKWLIKYIFCKWNLTTFPDNNKIIKPEKR